MHKAISVLFPYAVLLARHGQLEMLDAFTRAARASDSWHFMWHHLKPFTMMLFDKPNPPSLNWVLRLISPGLFLRDQRYNNSIVTWPAVVPSYAKEVDRSAVGEVLRVAFVTPGYSMATERPTVRQVRALGDAEVLRSYLLLIWSLAFFIDYKHEDFAEMQVSIREEFSGIGIRRHREDLIECLNQILKELEQRRETVVEEYRELKRLLLEVDGGAETTLTRTPPWLIHSGLLI